MVLHLTCSGLTRPLPRVGERRICREIALLALGLYVPRMLGMDVRIAAIATIIAIIVSSSVEMIVMARRRTMNVDPHPHND